jgi:uncharacterized phage protein (TIGR02218 family)
MLKDIGSLGAMIDSEVTRLATCWRVTRLDGLSYGFTDHDQDLLVEFQLYVATTGFTPSTVSGKADLSIDELELEGVLDHAGITEADLVAGRWDYSSVEIFFVDWSAPDAGKIKLRKGWLGQVSTSKGRFTAELNGLSSKLSQSLGREYGAWCDAKFCDARCGLDKTSFTSTQQVVAAANRAQITITALPLPEAQRYQNGTVYFESGENMGLEMEIKSNASATDLDLFLPLPFNIAAGDQVRVTVGCNKSYAACRDKFSNVVNFRGFPHVPTVDSQIAGPENGLVNNQGPVNEDGTIPPYVPPPSSGPTPEQP